MSYRIEIGDCLDLLKNVEDKSVDMILCDMPYGTTQNKWDSIIDLDALWVEYKRTTKDNACIALFSQMPFTATLAMSNLKLFRYEWIWHKNNPTGFLNANKMPLKEHENILIFYKKLPKYNPQGIVRDPHLKKRGTIGSNYRKAKTENHSEFRNYPRDVIKFGRDKVFHPTQKPVSLCEYLIRTYTDEGDIVLDNCMGSGTTGVACVNSNREFIGFEINEDYFNIAKERIEQAESDVSVRN